MATLVCAPPVHAEDWIYTVEFGGSTGLEGAAAGPTGTLGWRRARTRVEAGLDLKWDENLHHVYGARVFAELERRGGVGGMLRYALWPGPKLGFHAELSAILAPESLLGGGVGMTLLLPLSKKTSLFLTPSFTVFPIGSDLSSDSVLLWGGLTVGVRVDI